MQKLVLLIFLIFLLSCNNEPETNATSPVAKTGYEAIDDLSIKISQDSESANLYALRAEKYYEIEAYEQAISDMKQAMKIDSLKPDYYHLLADVYLDYEQSFNAIESLKKAATLYPKRIPTLLKLGEFQLFTEKYKDSFETLGQIMKIDPQNAEGFFLAGRIYKDQGDPDKAIAAMQKAVDNNPDLVDVWLELGDLYAAKNDEKAIQYYNNAIRIDTTYNYARFRRAYYLHQTGNLTEALAQYKALTLRDYNYVDAHYNSGLAYLEMDSVQLAYNNFDMACKVDVDFVMAYYYRGVVAEKMGKKQQAVADFKTALNLAPGFTRAREALEKIQIN